MYLHRYSTEIIIYGIDIQKDPFVIKEFDNEIRMRPHILSHNIRLNKIRSRLQIKIEIESINERIALVQASEELFEISNAVLNNVEGIYIQKGNVELIKT